MPASAARTAVSSLSGAGLSRLWPHDRAHWFFSRAKTGRGNNWVIVAVIV